MDLVLRCSSLPQLAKCSAPIVIAQEGQMISVDEAGEIANIGTAAHEAMISVCLNEPFDLRTIAEKHDIVSALADLEFCVRGGSALWRVLGPYFPDPKFEVPVEAVVYRGTAPGANDLGEVRTTGTIDALSILNVEGKKLARALDWKFGTIERANYWHQFAGYAASLLINHEVDDVEFVVGYGRLGIHHTHHFTARSLHAWITEELVGKIIRGMRASNGQPNYRPGDHCDWCRFSTACPGRRAVIRSAVADLISSESELDIDGIVEALEDVGARQKIGPAIFDLFETAKQLIKVAERMQKAVHDSVRTLGPMDIGDGKELAVTHFTAESIKVREAMPTLQTVLPQEKILELCSISKEPLEEAVKATIQDPARGAKTKAWVKVLDQLRTGGAMDPKPRVRYVVRDTAAPQEAPGNG